MFRFPFEFSVKSPHELSSGFLFNMSTAATALTDRFEIGGRPFTSRLIIGTGKYRSYEEMKAAHQASGAEMVTVAVRRVPLDRSSESFLDHLDPALQILPNTAGLLQRRRSGSHRPPGARGFAD